MANALTTAEFFGTPVSVIDHQSRRWLTAEEAGHCLGYNDANARQGINNLFKRHEDEFTEEDTCVISLMTQVQGRDLRIFSATGCQKLGFFANTARAKDFRTWAARVLAGNAVPPAPTSPDARLDRLDANMAQLAAGMSAVLSTLDVTRKYIGLLEINQQGQRKMTEQVRRQITILHEEGMNNASIARLLRVSRTSVSMFVNGKYPHAAPKTDTPAVEEVMERWLARERMMLAGAIVREGGVFLGSDHPKSGGKADSGENLDH